MNLENRQLYLYSNVTMIRHALSNVALDNIKIKGVRIIKSHFILQILLMERKILLQLQTLSYL